MIVECPECVSRFRLADDKLKPSGTKVRCSRCQKVFTVMPELDETSAAATGPGDVAMPSAASADKEWDQALSETGGSAFHEFDFGESWDDVSSLSGDPTLENEFSEDSAFDFAAFDEDGELKSDALFETAADEGEAFSFEDGSFPLDEEGGDSQDYFAEPTKAPVEDPSSELSPDSVAAGGAARSPLAGLHAGAADHEVEDGDAGLFAPPASSEGKPSLPPPARVPVRRKSKGTGLSLLFLLLLVGGAAGGYFAWKKDLLGSLMRLERLHALMRSQPEATESGQIRTLGLNGGFLQNRRAGRLFVIQGEAVNDYRESRSAIAVKGVLFDAKGAPLQQQTVFCGNPIDAGELETLPFDRIAERMNNQFGDSLSNLNVPAGKAVPFTIVFRNLPEGLSEFSVEVIDSKPASR
ncbi:DUF3426 domain-containing protein [Syntrophotalea acetylenica]|jgi:predicted Zn finger-like uncharacterized protein|uniref:FHA domain-containing protein n=1 Tax=Syntrophotalea acetylenica TaxID=29542 RepID=A0A1L3GGK6_SYNAC|nr:DUF3426 domain-containing protein [Syntrophotalea acetylenica]APG25066.1 hypothetical protein A7E75_08600 [Syntrophotalea acetylenica]APG43137.1 hypothetical protein A6070_02570 [Syntrophotalea acetylenica]